MKELLYLEIPTPDTAAVLAWLQQEWQPLGGERRLTPDGLQLVFSEAPDAELAIFLWSLQRTTYLKLFRWGDRPSPQEHRLPEQLQRELQQRFPPQYPALPAIDLRQQSIFDALAPHYPETVRYFRQMPQGETDLQRVYWWEKRWRDSVRQPQQPATVIVRQPGAADGRPDYDLIYLGGALGAIHAAVMAQRGYRVLLLERLAFGRMNREWNISRGEFQSLIDLGLFTPAEFEQVIACEYRDGFSKFFDGNNPPHLKAAILHTPTVLNIALDTSTLLQLCGEKLRAAGGEVWEHTEFEQAEVYDNQARVRATHLPTGETHHFSGRLIIDAMGTASPLAWQLNGDRTFDSVCPTVGAVIDGGFPAGVWDAHYGDVLNSHGDISRGRQLIWELFPGAGEELTIYLFHYHQVHPENPGSLLTMYEDFFSILPEYRRCDRDRLVWKKPTFGYIPGHFSVGAGDRRVAMDRLLAIGDAASLQSPLVFTGFGSLVRNLGRLTALLDVALKHDLLQATALNSIRAYQSNIAVTWLFSKGMMVPTGQALPPQRINAILNTFFGLLAQEPPAVADTFIKDRFSWLTFNRLALKAARQNPALIRWIWQQAGALDFLRWLGAYALFSGDALVNVLLGGWFPACWQRWQPWLEARYPGLWLRGLSLCYRLRAGRSPTTPPPATPQRPRRPAAAVGNRRLSDHC